MMEPGSSEGDRSYFTDADQTFMTNISYNEESQVEQSMDFVHSQTDISESQVLQLQQEKIEQSLVVNQQQQQQQQEQLQQQLPASQELLPVSQEFVTVDQPQLYVSEQSATSYVTTHQSQTTLGQQQQLALIDQQNQQLQQLILQNAHATSNLQDQQLNPQQVSLLVANLQEEQIQGKQLQENTAQEKQQDGMQQEQDIPIQQRHLHDYLQQSKRQYEKQPQQGTTIQGSGSEDGILLGNENIRKPIITCLADRHKSPPVYQTANSPAILNRGQNIGTTSEENKIILPHPKLVTAQNPPVTSATSQHYVMSSQQSQQAQVCTSQQNQQAPPSPVPNILNMSPHEFQRLIQHNQAGGKTLLRKTPNGHEYVLQSVNGEILSSIQCKGAPPVIHSSGPSASRTQICGNQQVANQATQEITTTQLTNPSLVTKNSLPNNAVSSTTPTFSGGKGRARAPRQTKTPGSPRGRGRGRGVNQKRSQPLQLVLKSDGATSLHPISEHATSAACPPNTSKEYVVKQGLPESHLIKFQTTQQQSTSLVAQGLTSNEIQPNYKQVLSQTMSENPVQYGPNSSLAHPILGKSGQVNQVLYTQAGITTSQPPVKQRIITNTPYNKVLLQSMSSPNTPGRRILYQTIPQTHTMTASSLNVTQVNSGQNPETPNSPGNVAQQVTHSQQIVPQPTTENVCLNVSNTSTILALEDAKSVPYTGMPKDVACSPTSSSADVNQPLSQPLPANSQSVMVNTTQTELSSAPEQVDYIVGQEYDIIYSNGTVRRALWDGKFFILRQKDMPEHVGQVRGGGGGDKSLQERVLKGNATGLNMKRCLTDGGGPNTVKCPIPVQKTIDGKQRKPLRSEGTSLQANANSSKNADGKVEETKEVVKRPHKPSEKGKYAMCPNCGNVSSDYNDCDSCRKPLPDEPKYYYPDKKQKMDGNSSVSQAETTTKFILAGVPGIDKKLFYSNKFDNFGITQNLTTLKGPLRRVNAISRNKGRPPKIKKPMTEPEMVTISSSEDEAESSTNLGGNGNGADSTLPKSTESPSTSRSNSPATPTTNVASAKKVRVRRIHRMEDESGNVVKQNPENGELLGGLTDVKVVLEARGIRIGSLRGQAFAPVIISTTQIQLSIESPHDTIHLDLMAKEINKVKAHLTNKMPVMFLEMTTECAERVQQQCNMTRNIGPFYDPKSIDDCQKYIVIILKDIISDQRDKLSEVFDVIEFGRASPQSAKIFVELNYDTANYLLTKSSPQVLPVPTIQSSIIQTTMPTIAMHCNMAQSQMMIRSQPALGILPRLTAYDDDEDDDSEMQDRSRSPSPPMSVFAGPIIKLFTYPPPPSVGGITVTNEDLFCLNDGEFLNDVIIDFYLKYMFLKIFKDSDRQCTHMFSSFFYRRLTQKPKRGTQQEDTSLTQSQRRHARVKTWTRHVDLFKKDFIIVPINESAHWYLAMICFPGLTEPEYEEKTTVVFETVKETKENSGEEPTVDKQEEPSSSTEESAKKEANTNEKVEENETRDVNEAKDKKTEENASSETDTKLKEGEDKKVVAVKTVQIVKRQPCILIFDSLAGPSRSGVIRTLREYLQVEWDTKKAKDCGPRVFDKDTLKGCNPRCPQQTNYSDCGVYVLHYVESFYAAPITDYSIPMKILQEWFPDETVLQKRHELRQLILDLQKSLNPDLNYDPSRDIVT